MADDNNGTPYIRPDKMTLSLENSLFDFLITESELLGKPAINIEADPNVGQLTLHVPFRIKGVDDDLDDLGFAKNFVHMPLTPDQARALRDQLNDSLDAIDNDE